MKETNSQNSSTKLPKVSKDALRALVHELTTDPTYAQRVFRYHNNQNTELMSGVVVAANKQADGDMRLQESFVKGAEYVLAALQRQTDSDYLQSLWEEDQAIELVTEEPPNVA